jgi:fructose-specific phosphotransferase system IIB component
MTVVAVTACPTGIAHTYMAAEQLAKAARKLGFHIKVETQGAMGLENELTAQEIARASVAILASDITLEKAERFDRIRTVRVSVPDAIKDPEGVLARCALDTAPNPALPHPHTSDEQRSA